MVDRPVHGLGEWSNEGQAKGFKSRLYGTIWRRCSERIASRWSDRITRKGIGLQVQEIWITKISSMYYIKSIETNYAGK